MKNISENPESAASVEAQNVVRRENLPPSGMRTSSYLVPHEPYPAGEGVEMRELFPDRSESGHYRNYLYFDPTRIEFQEVDTTGNTPDKERILGARMAEEGWEPLESGYVTFGQGKVNPNDSSVARFTRKKV